MLGARESIRLDDVGAKAACIGLASEVRGGDEVFG